MMRNTHIITAIAITLCSLGMHSQDNKACLKDVIRFEETNNLRNDTALERKNIFMSYGVKVTNWDNAATLSNVKVYKLGDNMHFFSEQANIYRDEKEVVIVMPTQKLLIINSTTKEMNSYHLNDDFFEMRKAFLDSCDVVKCEAKGANMLLSLKVNPKKVAANIKIADMTYEYNVEQKKILSVKINYMKDYKIKQLVMTYKDFSAVSTYKFAPLRKYVMDKHGKLLDRYRDYEVVDNRENGNKSRSRSK
jgi:hypothetical protein